MLRFDLRGMAGPPPERFITRLTRFEGMRLISVAADGSTAARSLTEQDMIPGTADWMMSTRLPRLSAPLAAVVVEINQPRHVGVLSAARLTQASDVAGGAVQLEIAIAILCGMLCMPLLFNFAFYRVLRARFLLWHILAVAFMLLHTLVASGLINRFANLSLTQLSVISVYSFGAGIMAAMLFSASLIERGKIDPVHRLLLRWAGLWVLAWSTIYLFAGGPLRPLSSPLYYASFVPVLGLFVWVMAVAWHRRSRAVMFQIAAWGAFMLTGVVRIVSMIGLTPEPLELQLEQHIALALEVVITTLGVADRLLIMRRDRDKAWAQARMLAARAERDPLTGLLNRHGIEDRFDQLYRAGFRAMAVVDLDHFKVINDTYGHTTGDEVLRAVAEALCPEDDTVAVRIGGEEFMLLLSGDNIEERAERCRQAVPARIAARVPGLNRMVTASMGLVIQPPGAQLASFALLYKHCDRLLYDAKAAGRNRTMSERMRGFERRAKVAA